MRAREGLRLASADSPARRGIVSKGWNSDSSAGHQWFGGPFDIRSIHPSTHAIQYDGRSPRDPWTWMNESQPHGYAVLLFLGLARSGLTLGLSVPSMTPAVLDCWHPPPFRAGHSLLPLLVADGRHSRCLLT